MAIDENRSLTYIFACYLPFLKNYKIPSLYYATLFDKSCHWIMNNDWVTGKDKIKQGGKAIGLI